MIVSLTIAPYSVPLRLHGTDRQRRGWWLNITTNDALKGVGDAAPWPGFGADAAVVLAELEALTRALPGAPVDETLATLASHASSAEVRNALETALLDLQAQRGGVPLSHLLAATPDRWVQSHVLVSNPQEAAAAAAAGAQAIKLKLMGPPPAAAQLARQVNAACPGLPLRLDANAGYDLAGALALIDAVADLAPEWLEQPVPNLADFAALRGRGVALAADESVAHHPLEVVAAAVDVLVIKPMFVGGARAAVTLASRARAMGKAVCVTHALESHVGRLAALHVAAAVGGVVHGVGDLDTGGAPMWLPTVPGLGQLSRRRVA